MLTKWDICDQKEGELAGKQVVPPVIGYPSQGRNFLQKKTFLVTSNAHIGYPSRGYILPEINFWWQYHSGQLDFFIIFFFAIVDTHAMEIETILYMFKIRLQSKDKLSVT